MGLFWNWMRKKPKEKRDYIFVDTKPLCCIKIIRGKYKDVVYRYGKVSFEERFGQPTLKFYFEIVDAGKHDQNTLNDSRIFHTMLGDILADIISNHSEKEDVYADAESDRTDYIEEPDLR